MKPIIKSPRLFETQITVIKCSTDEPNNGLVTAPQCILQPLSSVIVRWQTGARSLCIDADDQSATSLKRRFSCLYM